MTTGVTDLARDVEQIRDITIIGAGPVGLSAAFWAGMREASARVVDSLGEIGGQLAALYPEKWIYDVLGHPRVLARDLVELLRRQSLEQFRLPVHLDTRADRITWEDDPDEEGRRLVVLHTTNGELRSRAVIVAAGHGAFEPKRLPGFDITPWEGRGASYLVGDKSDYEGKRVMIVGGGDSACDWTMDLLETAERVTLVHRRENFRAHEATVSAVRRAAAEDRIDLHVPFQIRAVRGNGQIESVVLFHTDDAARETEVRCDALLLALGFRTALGPLREWGLRIEHGAIAVDPLMKTNLDLVWACGDVTTFDGKLKLIATGFAEAAVAVAQALHELRPQMRLQPAYSTNSGVPGVVEGRP